jgi:hypothetical protein
VLDPVLGREALRTRAATVVVATTGSATLSATATGFARASGSFITDGFADGMEIVGTGFSANNNGPKMIKGQVLTGFLPIPGGCEIQSATAGRTLSVGIPSDRRWENTWPTNPPAPGIRPYIMDEWGESLSRFLAGPKEGGHLEESGTYYLKWFGLANTGILAIHRAVFALKKLFTPGTQVTAGGLYVRVRPEGPVTGGLITLENGMAYKQLAIPWRCASINAVAA